VIDRSREPRGTRAETGVTSGPVVARNSDTEPLGLASWVLALYFVVEYSRIQDVIFPLQYMKLGLAAWAAGICALLFYRNHPFPREARPVVIFLGLMAAGIPFAQNPRVAFFTTLTVAQMLFSCTFLLMTATDSMKKLRFALWAFVAASTYQAFLGIKNGGVGIGYFVDENDLCMLAAMVAPIAYFLGATAEGWKARLVGFGLLFLSVLAGVASFSRGGFLAMVGTGGYLILRSPRRIATLLAITVALLLVYPLVPPAWYKEMATIETADQYGDTGETRLYMWGIAWHVYLDNPVVGVGPNNLGRHMAEFEDESTGHRSMWGRACHSIYFTLLAESGTVGTIVWLWMLLASVRVNALVARAVKRRAADPATARTKTLLKQRQLLGISRGLEASLIGFLVAGVFLTTNYYPNLWTLIGFMLATRLTLENDSDLAPLLTPAPAPEPTLHRVRA